MRPTTDDLEILGGPAQSVSLRTSRSSVSGAHPRDYPAPTAPSTDRAGCGS